MLTRNIKYTCGPDYSANSYFPFYPLNKTYNSILIPLDSDIGIDLPKLKINDAIYIWHNDRKTRYQIIYFCDTIIIQNQSYLLFYISRGIEINNIFLDKDKYAIELNHKKYNLDIMFNLSKNTPKLFLGLLVLSNNYSFAFHTLDRLILRLNNDKFINLQAGEVKTSFNTYSPQQSNTIIFLNLSESIDGLIELHAEYIINSMDLRSLTSKRIKEKGHIFLQLSGSHKLSITRGSFCKKLSFTNSILIDNLDAGIYTIEIFNKLDELVLIDNITVVDFIQNNDTIIPIGSSQLLPRF